MDFINTDIQNYAERFTSDESDILRELRGKTFETRNDKAMLSGFYQGRLLAMFSKMIAPRRILEIGTYMGYSGFVSGGRFDGRRENNHARYAAGNARNCQTILGEKRFE